MEIVQFNDKYVQDVVNLWNEACIKEIPYKPFDCNGFIEKFIRNPYFSYEGTFVAIEDYKVIGFANGIYKKEFLKGENYENTPGYLTLILVHNNYRNQHVGSELLKRVEEFLKSVQKKQIQVIFFNPINLEWLIPGTLGHDHPNSPGVDIESSAYKFLLENGYKERVKQNSYYLDLKYFKLSEKVLSTLEFLLEKDIVLEYYNPNKHYGIEELFDNLKNEYWRNDIKTELARKNPRPIIVASDKGKVCGFTGPLSVQPSGRGYFAGIGVHSGYSGIGIGTALFFKLCENLRNEGAEFMSLFTGENNPARKMYESAGFNIVKVWSVLEKEL